jgi:cytoskeletal protein RodZ
MRFHWLILAVLFVVTGCISQPHTPEVSVSIATASESQRSSGVSTSSRPSVSPNPNPSSSLTQRPKSATPTTEAILITNDTNAQVNLRAEPSVTSKLLGYGLVGDRVQVLKQAASADGERYMWYQVKFPSSGTIGWIREDYLRLRTNQIPS